MTFTPEFNSRGLRFAAILVPLLAFLLRSSPARADEDQPTGETPKPITVAKLDRKTLVDFEKEVLPVLNASCLACHNKTKPKAGLVLETPADILKGGDNGPAAVPGKPGDSLILKAAAHEVEAVMPPPNNKVAARDLTSEQLGLLKLWIEQGATGEVRGSAPVAWQALPASLGPIYAVAVSPDGWYAACGRGNRISVYDLKAGKLAATLSDSSGAAGAAHRDLVQSLAFSPHGETLASGSYREVKLWSRPESSDGEWALERTLGTGDPASPLADRVNALAFSPDGKRLATGGGVPSRGGEIRIWNVADGTVEKSFDDVHSDAVTGLAFSPDDKRLASSATDKFVRIVDLDTGKVLRSFEGHTHHALGVAWKRDGKVLASCGADNTLRFWDAETGERKKVVQNFEKEVTSVGFVGGTDQVLVTSGEGKVRLVNEGGNDVRSFAGASDFVYCSTATPDGKRVLAGGEDGVLRVWDGADGKSVTTFGTGTER